MAYSIRRASWLAILVSTAAVVGLAFATFIQLHRPGFGRMSSAAAQEAGPSTQPQAATQPLRDWRPPAPRSASERAAERRRMVETQIAAPVDGRDPVKDVAVLRAMNSVPRHAFVPADMQRAAYGDTPLPIGHGQTISQPYIVALMTEALELKGGEKVLEIGTGSGYQAAVLAQLTPHVCTIEIVEALGKTAQKALQDEGYADVKCRVGDGYHGWKEEGPFDGIIVTCAAGHLPPPLWEQLKPGGRIVVPVGGPFDVQRLVVITKTPEGKRRSTTITDVRFVPMTGEISRP